MTTTFAATLEQFIASDEFAPAVMSSTTAGFAGSGYSVELLPDGTWRVLWNGQIGNLYESPGVVLGIPQHTQETVDDLNADPDADVSWALDEIKDTLRETLSTKWEDA